MDHSEDVERLFSWLKAPMVHYREFAPQAEISEAVATWPIVHKAAVETGVAGETAAPQGDAAARERIARYRARMPSSTAAVEETAPPPTPEAPTRERPTPGRLSDRPSSQFPAAAYRDTAQAVRAEHADLAASAPEALPEEPPMTGFEEPSAAPRPLPATQPTYRSELPEPPARDRGALFGGGYREPEREPAAGDRPGDRQERPLDAVFTRLSGGRDRLPDPRARLRTTPGLGAVFNRLR